MFSALIILVVSFLLAEVVLFVFEPRLFKGDFEYDPDLGFRNRPYFHGTNRFGFNDRDYPSEKPPGVFRILFLGDSFSWIGGPEGNYAALIEKKFEEYYGEHKVDVINVGYGGTHTGQQLTLLKKYGLLYHPDMVILGFFAGNDFIDAVPHRKRIVLNGMFLDIDSRHERNLFGRPLVLGSRLLLWIQQRMKIRQEMERAEEGVLTEEAYLKYEGIRMDFYHLTSFRTGKYRERIRYILQSVSEMNGLLKSRGTRLIVAIYPAEFSVDEKAAQRLFDYWGLKREDYDLELAQKILQNHLTDIGVPFVDLTRTLKEENKKGQVFGLGTAHWNDRGVQTVANLLFDTLVESLKTDFSPPTK